MSARTEPRLGRPAMGVRTAPKVPTDEDLGHERRPPRDDELERNRLQALAHVVVFRDTDEKADSSSLTRQYNPAISRSQPQPACTGGHETQRRSRGRARGRG